MSVGNRIANSTFNQNDTTTGFKKDWITVGRGSGKAETALKMIQAEWPVDTVAEYTELPIAMIQGFKEMEKMIVHQEMHDFFDELYEKTGLKEIFIARAIAEKAEGRAEEMVEVTTEEKIELEAKAALNMFRKGYQTLEIADALKMPINWIESLGATVKI